MTAITSASPFDAIKQVRPDGSEFWSARDLMSILGYDKWERFEASIERAIVAMNNQPDASFEHGERHASRRWEASGRTERVNYDLTRYGAYMVAMNGDPRKERVAEAQRYFAIRTRQAETRPQRELTGPELMAKALIEANATLQQALPKAEAYDAFLSTAGDYSVNEAAKILSRDHGIHKGERKLRDLLIEWGWIYREAGEPRAKQAQINTGRLAEKASFYYHPSTGERVAKTPQVRVTPKGIDAIRQRLVGLKVLTA